MEEVELEFLIGHEVGHALFTPSDLWVDTIIQFSGDRDVFKSCVNIIEDARIERKIKIRYPGLKRTFFFGYDCLYERGVFEISDESVFYLINRLNYYFKIRNKVSFEMDEVFWDFVNRIENAESFVDVLPIAYDLYKQCEKENAIVKNKIQSSNKDEDTEKSLKESLETPEEKTQEQKTEIENKKEEASSFSEDFKDGMEKKLENFLKDMVSNENVVTVFMPEPILENIVIPYKAVLKYLSNVEYRYSMDEYSYTKTTLDNIPEEENVYDMHISSSMKNFNKRFSSSINYYKKVFEMKKKAAEFKRILEFKTGKLNMNKLTSYKFNENIFLANKITNKGKNHGLIIYLDMSSSMRSGGSKGYHRRSYSNYINVITQTLELVSFCRAINIPVSVYGFSNSSTAVNYLMRLLKTNFHSLNQWDYSKIPNFNQETKKFNRIMKIFALIEIFNPSMTNKEFVDMFESLLSGVALRTKLFNLASTPLAHAISTLEAVTNNFKSETNVQIVNVTFITDGGDTEGTDYYLKGITNISDTKTKKSLSCQKFIEKYKLTNFKSWSYVCPAMILNHMKNRMGKNVHVVNFYIGHEAGNKYYKISEKQLMEFDEFYFVNPVALRKTEEKAPFEDLSLNKTIESINENFIKKGVMMKEKCTMINSFISQICGGN